MKVVDFLATLPNVQKVIMINDVTGEVFFRGYADNAFYLTQDRFSLDSKPILKSITVLSDGTYEIFYTGRIKGIPAYKLQFYYKHSANKGNRSHTEYFNTLEEMQARYKEVFVYSDYSLNPTKWVKIGTEWKLMY